MIFEAQKVCVMRNIILFISIVAVGVVNAQSPEVIRAYIAQFKDAAVREMVNSKIPASITLAQGIHESNCGRSPLAREANNHFGIKCHVEWNGPRYAHDDDKPQECFRVYSNADSSYIDHSYFLTSRPRYSSLFNHAITDYKAWAHGLKAAGYATNPQYAFILIKTIEENGLADFDKEGLKVMADGDKKKEAVAVKQEDKPEHREKHHHHKEKSEEAPLVAVIEEPVMQPEPETKTWNKEKQKREVFTVNGVRAVRAIGDEDPLRAAIEMDVDYSLLMQYNDLNTAERFTDGEYIFLEPKKNKGSEEYYMVKSGESMRDIAQRFGIKLAKLYELNGIRMNDQPHASEMVNLRSKRSNPVYSMSYSEFLKTQSKTRSDETNALPTNSSSASASTSASLPMKKSSTENKFTMQEFKPEAEQLVSSERTYEVQQKETLFAISKKFGVSVEQLREWNSLASNDISIGQVLIVGK